MGSWVVCRHVPYALAGELDVCTSLEGRGARGERVALSFDLVSEDAPLTVSMRATALTGARGRLPAESIDVWVVSVRDLAGLGVYRAAATAAPEWLLKDEPIAIETRYRRFCGHVRHLHRLRHGLRYYQPPDLRLAGPASTRLAPFTRKQVWITVSINGAVAPGWYGGAVIVEDHARQTEATIRLEVEVLDLDLRPPRQRRMLWFRGTRDCARPQFYLEADQMARQLRDIRAHGFDTISIGERSLRSCRQVLALVRAAGFTTVVIAPPYPPGLGRADWAGLDAIAYVSDEIDQRGAAWYPSHQAQMQAADRLGLPTMTSLVRERFTAQFAPLGLGPVPDVVSVYLPSNLDYVKTAHAFPAQVRRDTLYYWMASMEKPNVHRVLAGLYLWKSGAAGISPYCYQHWPRFPHSPYDDFDDWEPGATVGTDAGPIKDQLATYPARRGSVPTLQWEGMGEGLTDLQYLATVEALVDLARPSRDPRVVQACAEAEGHLRALSAAVPLAPIEIVDAVAREPYAHLGAADYAAFRRTLADDACALTRALAARPDQVPAASLR